MNTRRQLSVKTAAIILIVGLLLSGCASGKIQEQAPGQGTQYENGGAGGPVQPDDANQAGDGNEDSLDGQNGGKDSGTDSDGNAGDGAADDSRNGQGDADKSPPQPIDLSVVKPNEAGRVMVVMFHNFIEKYEKGDKDYTTTFDAFEELLENLYEADYRLISLNDYISGNIDTPAGCIPMVFTFDDGTPGQFNLIEENGELKVNPRSAAGMIHEFNKTHPDFGVRGTFFVNLGNQTFSGAGTLEQRLEYLVGMGFELGNHTYSHINLKKDGKTAAIIQKEIGGNQKELYELIPGYTFTTFSLPYGAPAKELVQYVIKGEYEGVSYENRAIMKVGAEPAQSPFGVKFDPLATPRVRSSGIDPVAQDLAWWLENMKRSNQFVSDGDPETVTVPADYEKLVNKESLGDRKLVIY
ncbi:MAG: polysaccharide deacetylase family protein [Clostridiaceae bacterium]|nr:polysaccharide deacetylase family protein [Clostridiaceae bacterium]